MTVPFGHIIGIDANNVIAYSSDHRTKKNQHIIEHSFISINHSEKMRKIFCGIKYQCVEYVRRWLISTSGISFQQIDNAHMLYTLDNIIFTNIYTNRSIRYNKCSNGSADVPERGTLVIWDRTDAYPTGHVAVVHHTDGRYIYIGEQNWDDRLWDESYSRKIRMTRINDSIVLDDRNAYGLQIIGWLKLIITF